MKRPRPRTVFVNAADEAEHTLNCLCWLQAKGFRRRFGSRGEIADELVAAYHRGEIVIERAPCGIRLWPAHLVEQPYDLYSLIRDTKAAADEPVTVTYRTALQ